MITIYWAGDSTVKQNTILTYPQTGIGQAFDRYINRWNVRVENHAENGRSTKSFIDEGRLAMIYDRMTAGDYMFIQFGHNDEKIEDPARYSDAEVEFCENLERFVNTARNKKVKPVFITPLARRLFAEKDETYRHTAWAEAMKRTGERLNVPVIDLTAMSEALVDEMGAENAKTSLYMNIPAGVYPAFPNGLADGTHLQPLGAMTFAGLVAKGLYELGGEYAELLCAGYEQFLARDEDLIAEIQKEGADERR